MLTRYQRKKLAESISIIDVFRHYHIRLIHDGAGRFKSHCPFHQDRTPSLKIYPEEDTWYAYCCGKGTSTWDFIREKEDDYWQAEEVLKQLATIDLPEDPLDDLVNELQEKTKERHQEKIQMLSYLISVTLRDFLISKKNEQQYCEKVDSFFKELDERLECEDLEEKELKMFREKVEQYIKQHK